MHLPRSSLHDLGNCWPLGPVVVIVLKFDPGIDRISRFPVLADVNSLVFSLGIDAQQVKVVQAEEDQETAEAGPQSNADTPGDIDSEEIPWLYRMTLQLKCS
jgi:hypothetical protein